MATFPLVCMLKDPLQVSLVPYEMDLTADDTLHIEVWRANHGISRQRELNTVYQHSIGLAAFLEFIFASP